MNDSNCLLFKIRIVVDDKLMTKLIGELRLV